MDEGCVLSLSYRDKALTAAVYDRAGRLMSSSVRPLSDNSSPPDAISPDEILTSAITLLEIVVRRAGISPYDVCAIGVSASPHAVVAWEAVSGLPLFSFFIPFSDAVGNPDVRLKSLQSRIASYDISSQSATHQIIIGGIESWLIWNLTQGQNLVLDAGHDLVRLKDVATDGEQKWLQDLGISMVKLPRIVRSVGVIGRLSAVYLDGARIPVTAVTNHQSAAHLGAGIETAGEAYVSYERDGFAAVRSHALSANIHSFPGTLLFTQEASVNPFGTDDHILVGRFFVPQLALAWVDQFASESPSYAEISAAISDGDVVVSNFSKSSTERAAIIGITDETSASDIYMAGLRALAFTAADLLDEFSRVTTVQIDAIHCERIGYGTYTFLSLQAAVSGTRVYVHEEDCASLGVALLAGIGAGIWDQQSVFAMLRERSNIKELDVPDLPKLREHARLTWRKLSQQLWI